MPNRNNMSSDNWDMGNENGLAGYGLKNPVLVVVRVLGQGEGLSN
jgi:hypothetical protein